MAYVFENQSTSTTKATITGADAGTGIYTHNLQGISGTETSADSIMAGVNELYGIVGWSTTELTRTVKQNAIDDNN